MRANKCISMVAASVMIFIGSAEAHELNTKPGNAKPAFDIVKTDIKVDAAKNWLIFSMQVSGKAGSVKPTKSGKFAGSRVFSYVWPTQIDPAEVGFEAGAGILALAVTSHPDFDDVPVFNIKGADWHSHWVVLVPDEVCGKGALKVKDIPEGTNPRLPKTWPGVPILIDSPGYPPAFNGSSVSIRVPFDDVSLLTGVAFDGVTAGLQINASAHQPLLCVVNVFDVASGDLSMPGKTQ